MLGVVACAWRVNSGAGSQESDQIIMIIKYIYYSNNIINDKITAYNSGL